MEALDLGLVVVRPPLPRTDRHWLSGTVRVDGVPAGRRVALFQRVPLTLIAVTRSRTDGTYEFKGLPEYPERSLKAVAYDDDLQKYNAQVCDFLTQGLQPAARTEE